MLINSDCFEYLSTISSGTIDLILTDPPYLISKESNFKKFSESSSDEIKTKYGKHSIDFGEWDKGEIDFNLLFKEYYRVLRGGGTVVVFFDIWKSNLIREIALENGFKQPRIGQWQKNNAVPINSKINYLSNAIEYFFTFTKGKNPTFNSLYDRGIYNYPLCHGKDRLKHPTQKPLGLMIDLVNKHSNPGDLVLDTFAGTGTTANACLVTNREYIMIEKDLEYFNIMKNRIDNINN